MATYDLQTLQAAVLSAAAVAALPANVTTLQVVNRALEYMTTCHGWHWRIVLADLGSGAAVDLPANFGELVAVVPRAGTKRMVKVSHAELLMLRQHATEVSQDAELSKCCFYTLTGKAQANVTSEATWKLEFAPACANITVAYKRLAPVLAGNTDKADIPLGFFDLFLQLCRCFATNMVKPTSGETPAEWVLADRMVTSLKEADARAAATDQVVIDGVFEEYQNVGRFKPTWS